jgi:hypothetical protein
MLATPCRQPVGTRTPLIWKERAVLTKPIEDRIGSRHERQYLRTLQHLE